jgi:uncharacterized protein (TIGR03000 family)
MRRKVTCILAAMTVSLSLASEAAAQVGVVSFGSSFSRPRFVLGGGSRWGGYYPGYYPWRGTSWGGYPGWSGAYPSWPGTYGYPGVAALPGAYGFPGPWGYGGLNPGLATSYLTGPVWATGDAYVRANEFSMYNPPRMRATLHPAVPLDALSSSAVTPAGFASKAARQEEAHIQVKLPSAAAEVWIEGTAMSQTGALRDFVSPPLNVNDSYTYEIRARWRGSDGMRSEVRRIPVRAGGHYRVDFTKPMPTPE